MRKRRKRFVACADEAGRGPLAGPVIAAATLVYFRRSDLRKLVFSDSKKLSPKKRKEIYNRVIKNPGIKFAIGKVSEKIIDRINILEATKMAMGRAVKKLEKKLKRKINLLLLDGNFKINSKIPQRSIIKADEKIFSCRIASIIAKVYRDKIMEKMHQKYPFYGFQKHKGYGTKHHLRMLKKYGPCKIHRKTFGPVRRLLRKDT